MTAAEALQRPSAAGWWRAASWLVSLSLLGWILSSTDLAGMARAVTRADWLLFWGSMAGLFAVSLAIDSVGVWWLFRRFHLPSLRLGGVVLARAASGLIGIVNYAAGVASLSVWFRRSHGIPLLESGASLLLLTAADAGVLLLIAAAGAPLLPAAWRMPLLSLGAAAVVVVGLHLLFWRGSLRIRALDRFRERPSFRGFREARISDYLALAALRAPNVLVYVAMHLATLRAFGLDVPWQRLLVYVPSQMLVAALPISVSGIGTVQVLQREQYGPWAQSLEEVDAYALALVAGFMLPRVAVGLIALGPVSRALAHAGAPVDSDPRVLSPRQP